ncbi:hypothetical protein Cantr_10691 [Candida viswanathii]|uniref:Uncharacterized protein n=1 Tax=Candida viswanathii TaxID=5486 RepID=A0A367YD58_9ASCO|nr:hypothetical protein Cantr_10691 [Candida viswanathii]
MVPIDATHVPNNNRQGTYDDDVTDPAEHLNKAWELLKDDVDDYQPVENEQGNPLQIISVWPAANNTASEVPNRRNGGNEHLIVSVFCDPATTASTNATKRTTSKRRIP